MNADLAICDAVSDAEDAPPDDDGNVMQWGITVVTRAGNPPLRFRGRLTAEYTDMSTPDMPLTISLWERQKGGFVLSHSVDRTPSASHAVNLASRVAATSYLEEYCEGLAKSGRLITFDPSDPGGFSEAMRPLYQHMVFRQRFRRFVGDVLADWSEPKCASKHQENSYAESTL